MGRFRVTLHLCLKKRVFAQNLSCQDKFDLSKNKPEGRIHFHVNDLPRRPVSPTEAKGNSEMAHYSLMQQEIQGRSYIYQYQSQEQQKHQHRQQ